MLGSAGTILPSTLLPGAASLVSAMKEALLVTSQQAAQPEHGNSPPTSGALYFTCLGAEPPTSLPCR